LDLPGRVKLVAAAKMLLACNYVDCPRIAGLSANTAANTTRIIHSGFALDNFEKSIGTGQDTLKAAGTLFKIDSNYHVK